MLNKKTGGMSASEFTRTTERIRNTDKLQSLNIGLSLIHWLLNHLLGCIVLLFDLQHVIHELFITPVWSLILTSSRICLNRHRKELWQQIPQIIEIQIAQLMHILQFRGWTELYCSLKISFGTPIFNRIPNEFRIKNSNQFGNI